MTRAAAPFRLLLARSFLSLRGLSLSFISLSSYSPSRCLPLVASLFPSRLQVFRAAEERRTKFIPRTDTTRELAEYIKQAGEHYGPPLPDVPGAGKYSIDESVQTFLNDENSRSAVIFKLGGIPTGVPEVGAPPNWWAGVHAPPSGMGSTAPPPKRARMTGSGSGSSGGGGGGDSDAAAEEEEWSDDEAW